MNNFRLIKITIFLMLGILSCTHDPILVDPDSMGTYYLFSKISAYITPIGAVVGYSLPETMPEDVSGAVVTLSSNGQSAVLDELQPGVYADEQEQVDIVPGERYDISARINDDVLLYAHTYIPGEFRLLKEDMPDTLDYIYKGFTQKYYPYFSISEYVSPQIRYSKSEHAFWYSIGIFYNGIASFDTCSVLPAIEHASLKDTLVSEWTEKIKIKITAFDSTFLPYQHSYYYDLNKIDPIIEDYISKGMKSGENDNIHGGGFGYFSSTYTITDSVIVRFKKEILTFE